MEMLIKGTTKSTRIYQRRLILGIITGIVMMAVSYLMDGYGLLPEEQALALRPPEVYTVCMLLAMIGVPAMCLALSAWYRIVCDARAKQWVRRLFVVSAASYAISSLYIIAVDCLPPVIFQNAVALGIKADDALTLVKTVQQPFVIPVVVFFLIEDTGVSVALWQLIFSGTLNVPKCMAVCCPLAALIIDLALKAVPAAAARDISVTMESFGWLLFMTVGLVHIGNEKRRITKEIKEVNE